MDYTVIKENFQKGLWTKAMVHIAVVKGVITSEQYEEITGKVFVMPKSS